MFRRRAAVVDILVELLLEIMVSDDGEGVMDGLDVASDGEYGEGEPRGEEVEHE
jgi:hypothetical protein